MDTYLLKTCWLWARASTWDTVSICVLRQKNGIEPLTQTTVYPDTIWRERKQNGEIKTERRKGGKRERDVYTSFKVHSADNQAFFWGHHPGTGSESGSPFPPPPSDPSFVAFLRGQPGEGNTDKDIIVVLLYFDYICNLECIEYITKRVKCGYSLVRDWKFAFLGGGKLLTCKANNTYPKYIIIYCQAAVLTALKFLSPCWKYEIWFASFTFGPKDPQQGEWQEKGDLHIPAASGLLHTSDNRIGACTVPSASGTKVEDMTSKWHVLLITKGHPLLPRPKLAEMTFGARNKVPHIQIVTSLFLKIMNGQLAPSGGQKVCARGRLVGLCSLELSTATE